MKYRVTGFSVDICGYPEGYVNYQDFESFPQAMQLVSKLLQEDYDCDTLGEMNYTIEPVAEAV